MGTEIVHDDDVTGFQGRHKNLLDISQKTDGVDRTVEDERRVDAIDTQSADKGHGFPVPVRDFNPQTLAFAASAVRARHVGFDPCFVYEHQAARIDFVLMPLPALTLSRDIRPVLLAGQNAFF